MNRWSSPQIVRSMLGHGSRSTRYPPPPLGTLWPWSSTTSALMPGSGRIAEPGLVGVRRAGGASVRAGGGAGGPGRVDGVGVPGRRADVRGARVVVGVGLVGEARGEVVPARGRVPAGGVQDALGLRRRPAGVEDEQ